MNELNVETGNYETESPHVRFDRDLYRYGRSEKRSAHDYHRYLIETAPYQLLREIDARHACIDEGLHTWDASLRRCVYCGVTR